MTAVRLIGLPDLPADSLVMLAEQVSLLASLADVAAWAATWTPPACAVDAVEQDEFSHDIVLGLERGVHVVFAST